MIHQYEYNQAALEHDIDNIAFHLPCYRDVGVNVELAEYMKSMASEY